MTYSYLTQLVGLLATVVVTLQAADSVPKPPHTALPAPESARQIQYSEHDIVAVAAKLRFTTLIHLPKGEQILDFLCGNKEFWQVSGVQNFAFVKPSKQAASTSLHLLTAAGNVYAFVLTEVGETATTPDLELEVATKDTSLLSAIHGEVKFVPASAVEDFKAQYEIAKQNERIAREQADLRIREANAKWEAAQAKARNEYPTRLKFPYRFARNQAPFQVSAIFHDDRFTYIQAHPEETPAVYEVKDGQPSLVQFVFQDGLYTIPKIVTEGYLAIGKKKLSFVVEEPGK